MAYSTGDAHLELEGVQPAQVLAGLAAFLFVLIGGIGLLRTGSVGLGEDEVTVLGVTLSPLRSWIYLGLGLFGLVETMTSATARAFGWLMFAGCGTLFVWGLMLNGLVAANPVSALGDPLHLSVSDGWWHLVIAVAGLVIAVIPARKAVYVGSVRAAYAPSRSLLPPDPAG